MSREFEVHNFDDYTDEQLDELLDEFTNIIIDIKRERGIEEADDEWYYTRVRWKVDPRRNRNSG